MVIIKGTLISVYVETHTDTSTRRRERGEEKGIETQRVTAFPHHGRKLNVHAVGFDPAVSVHGSV